MLTVGVNSKCCYTSNSNYSLIKPSMKWELPLSAVAFQFMYQQCLFDYTALLLNLMALKCGMASLLYFNCILSSIRSLNGEDFNVLLYCYFLYL